MARKEKEYHFIYKTTNIINNKYYIGMHSTNNLEDGYVGSGKRLWYSINKYGKDNFKVEIIEFLDNMKLLKEKEREYVNENLLKDKKCMNIKLGGEGGFTSNEAKKGRIATDKILYEKYGENFHTIVTKKYHDSLTKEDKEIFCNKVKDGQLKVGFNYNTFEGKKHSDESIEKMKLTHKLNNHQQGEKNSNYGKCWIYNNELKQNKKIKKEELENYLIQGWSSGRKMKF